MASATNRTEILAKALKHARPDFTLRNARIFARAVIDAPANVFCAKPLKFLPQDNIGEAPISFVLDEYAQAGGPHSGIGGLAGTGKVYPFGAVLVEIPDEAEFFRNVDGTPSSAIPIAVTDARPGDVIVIEGESRGVYVREGLMQLRSVAEVLLEKATQLERTPTRKLWDPKRWAPSRDQATTSAAKFDSSLPNHFHFDGLGDPLTCTEEHNHPDPDDEPRRNIAIRAEHELCALPAPLGYPPLAPLDEADRVHVAFPLGVGPDGEAVTYNPAVDGPLLVFGGPGRGKSTLAQGLLRYASVSGWKVSHVDGRHNPAAILEKLRSVHAELELRRLQPIGAVPMLLVLDDVLRADFDTAQREESGSLVADILSVGRELGIHSVLVTFALDSETMFPPRWRQLCSTVLLTGQPTYEDAIRLVYDAADMLPSAGWEGAGRMLLVRNQDIVGGFLLEPLRAYMETGGYTGY